jgi:hypothetical protein
MTDEEMALLKATVAKLNAEGGGRVTFRLVESKGTWYIYPEFPA